MAIMGTIYVKEYWPGGKLRAVHLPIDKGFDALLADARADKEPLRGGHYRVFEINVEEPVRLANIASVDGVPVETPKETP